MPYEVYDVNIAGLRKTTPAEYLAAKKRIDENWQQRRRVEIFYDGIEPGEDKVLIYQAQGVSAGVNSRLSRRWDLESDIWYHQVRAAYKMKKDKVNPVDRIGLTGDNPSRSLDWKE